MDSIPVNPQGAAIAAIDRWMIERGYSARERADAKTHARLTGELDASIIRADDQVEAAAVWRVASWLAVGAPALPEPLPVVAGSVPWERFELELMEQYAPALRAKATRRCVQHAVRVLRELGVEQTGDLNVRLITKLVTTRDPNLSPNTVKGLLRTVQAVCSHAINFGYLPVSPFAARPIRTWVRGTKPRGVKHLTRLQIRAVLDVLAADVRSKRGWSQYRARRLEALVTLIVFTGLRRSEALHLQVEDIDLEGGIVQVVSRAAHRLKTDGSEKPVPLLPPAVEVLREWLGHRMDAPKGFNRPVSPWVFPNLRKPTPWRHGPVGCKPIDRLQAVAKRAGVPAASFQMLRRSVGTHLEGAGCGAAMIQRILRHSNVATTQTFYLKADLANMREAMAGFTY